MNVVCSDTTEVSWFPGVGAYNVEILEPLKTRGNRYLLQKLVLIALKDISLLMMAAIQGEKINLILIK
jgi:hypothetical protein